MFCIVIYVLQCAKYTKKKRPCDAKAPVVKSIVFSRESDLVISDLGLKT